MNDQILTSFSIITSFHDKSKSVMDSFLPLVEYGIAILCNETNSDELFDTDSLREKILNSSGIDINTITLKSLLKKIKKAGHIELLSHGNYFKVLHSLKNQQDTYLCAIQDSYRNIHKFIKEYKSFSSDNRAESELIIWIYDFICTYCKFIDVSNNNITAQFESEEYKNLLSFLDYINESEIELTKTFHSIYFGANIYSLLDRAKNVIDKKSFKELVVYLDSNFILRLMDYQEAPFSKETNELFATLRKNNIRLKIFRETVDEVKSVLSYYLSIYRKEKENHMAILSQPEYINGVLGAFYRKNCTFSEIEDSIDIVENFIKDKNIEIDNIERFKITIDEKEVLDLYQSKYGLKDGETPNDYRINKCKHYLQIMDIIHYFRQKNHCSSSCLGNSKYVFLTCDLKLYRYCRSKTANYRFPTIITQEILANDLMLFNPQDFSDVSLQLLISLCKNSGYIDIHTLDKLNDTIKKISKENPSEAELIIKATRNCENYGILNNLFEDDIDDHKQLLALAENIRTQEKETQETLRNNEIAITEAEDKNRAAIQKITELETKLLEDQQEIKDNIERERKEYFLSDIKPYIKKTKLLFIALYILFALAEITITLVTGFTSWFSLPLYQTWWIYLTALIVFVGTILSAILKGIDNKLVNFFISKKEKALQIRYKLSNETLSEIRKQY